MRSFEASPQRGRRRAVTGLLRPTAGSEHPYDHLTPEVILDAVETTGARCDGVLQPLPSYENRVYHVGVEDPGLAAGSGGAASLVVKFYRPGRWDDPEILEEHRFALDLAGYEIPVVAPLEDSGGETLHHHAGFRFALYPRRGGRAPELSDRESRVRIGRLVARIHAVGATGRFSHRPRLDVARLGHQAREAVLASDLLCADYAHNYRAATGDVLTLCEAAFEGAGAIRWQRIHGDCHAGNLLWTDVGPHFVDLDDCGTGPAIQDLWMLLGGGRAEMVEGLTDLLEGYAEFHQLDLHELWLVEALRALRLIHYAGWLALRWGDPAFPRAFPWFGTPRFWEDHVQTLREQCERLQEPPLSLD